MKPPVLPDNVAALAFVCVLLMPCAVAGLALLAAGLARSRNVAHSLLSALCAVGVAGVVYFAVGAAWQGTPGGREAVLWAGGRPWGWIGSGRLLLLGVSGDVSSAPLFTMFGLFAVCLAAIIPLGAAAERWRLGACCASTAGFAALVYAPFAHWTWGGGWLAQLGATFHLGGGFLDTGGAGTVQAAGGLAALALAWILGPRRGKFHPDGTPAAVPAHNAAFVLAGCFLAWLGYLGLNCAGALLFARCDVRGAAIVPLNVTLSAGAALLAAAAVTRLRYRVVDASLCANAWVAGLAAASAASSAVTPAGSVIVGLVAGTLVIFSVEWLELRLKIDDPAGAVSVHAIGGLWGLLAAGVLANTGPEQWLAQVVGIAALLGFVLPAAYGFNWLLDRRRSQRVPPDAERRGLDLHELGAGAYPDFMTHEEF
ncbi:MAG: ammonium transporter [Acidobacteria bacterium]|nr:ammonium transporter [Acidobacteriota bacterium]